MVNNDLYLSSTHRMHRCVFIATMFRRTRYNVTLYVLTLPSVYLVPRLNTRGFIPPIPLFRPHLTPLSKDAFFPEPCHLNQTS